MGNTSSTQLAQQQGGGDQSDQSAHRNNLSPGHRAPTRSRNHEPIVLAYHHHHHQHHRTSAHLQNEAASRSDNNIPSSHPNSPRRRKSLELPDLNTRLAFTASDNVPANNEDVFEADPIVDYTRGSDHTLNQIAPVSLGNASPRGNTGSKRISLTTGTRARSPTSRTDKNIVSLDGTLTHTATAGVPILGARTDRRPSAAETFENPYFPAIVQERPPTTPGLPRYSHGSAIPGSSDSSLGAVEHAEHIDTRRDATDRLSINTNTLQTGPRQPSPARPAPAILTAKHHDHDHDHVQASPQEVISSALPKGTSAVSELGPMNEKDPDLTPLASLPPSGQTIHSGEETDARSTTIPTLVTWNEGGENVYVTGTFAETSWKTRLRMNKSTHDFSLTLNLPPGTHRLKFIVDDHWRCSTDLQTATDGDGNLVNWLEVEAPKSQAENNDDWAMSEWVQMLRKADLEEDESSMWTSEIPPALTNFQSIEERARSDPPEGLSQSGYTQYRQHQDALLASVPIPPVLPRHLKDVILNTTPKELEGTVGGAAGDDNSILPVPNHVVLNHLTASAIKNGTLAVGTTTRYKRKYISTIFFKPVRDY